LANLDNWLTTMKMASITFHLGSWVMKSMDTLSHGSPQIGKGLYNPYFFFYIDFMLWHLAQSAHKMLYILLHFKLIKFLSHDYSYGYFTTVSHHGNIMFFLHDFRV
jgi:hypothetical protein